MSLERPTLYSIYDENNQPLYIGKSMHGNQRIKNHAREKEWWPEVKLIVVEHFHCGERLAFAEELAIRRETPKYNIQYNSSKAIETSMDKFDDDDNGALKSDEYVFDRRKYGGTRTARLWLKPEIDQMSMWGDLIYDGYTEDEAGWYIVNNLQKYPGFEEDEIKIYWFVHGVYTRDSQGGTPGMGSSKGQLFKTEFAPYDSNAFDSELSHDFLTFFTWPTNYRNEPINWFRMPVYDDRFPEFWKWLGWTPAPLTKYCPLNSIIAAKESVF